jgi:hypothetical protein
MLAIVRPARVLELALLALLVWFGFQAVQLARLKYFTIDEFQYSHAAWLVAKGQMPYRDFFEVHFPLVYQVLSPVFLIAGDDPTAVVGLRLGMLPFVAMAAGAVAFLNLRQSKLAALAAPVLLLALPSFVTLATEVRPDAIAAALFLGSLAVLRIERLGDRMAAAISGLLLVASMWGTQKATFYGAIFGLAFLADLVALRRGSGRSLLRNPVAFLSGGVAGVAVIAMYLTATGSWAAWWHWCFAWAVEHQRNYPGFPWRKYFDPILVDSLWLFLLAAWGLVRSVQVLRTRRRDAWSDPDALLIGALISTFASIVLQRAPYPYSFLAFLGVVAVYAARGIGDLLAARTRPLVPALLGVALVAVLTMQGVTLAGYVATTNAGQLQVLDRIGKLTGPTDAAYDNSGGYVARPHAYFYFYTDSFLRESIAETLDREVPQGILDRGAVLHLRDIRFDSLPASLKKFLDRHFQPVDGDISLWGEHYVVPPAGVLQDTFLASRDDRYFISPASALTQGTLTIDGEPVRDAIFQLKRGEHRISYQGGGEIDILWLPRDGKTWQPQRGLPPTFSRVF